MMHRKWSIFWMSSEKLGTGGRRASAVPNLMYSILIIAQNRGNFLEKKLLLYPTADKEAKNKQRAGEKVKKEMQQEQRAGEKAEKEMHLRRCRQEEAKNKQRAGEKAKKEMHPRQHAVELFGKKLLLYPTADKEAKNKRHAAKKVKKIDAPAAASTRLNN